MKTSCLCLLSVGLLAGCLVVDTPAWAQVVSSPAASLQTWRNTSQGLSSNAALAFYRVQNTGGVRQNPRVAPPLMPRGRTLYSAPYYTITNRRTVVTSPTVPVTRTALAPKPFNDLQRHPNAVERYWPLLLEGREDQHTGLVIWTLP